MSKRRNNRTRKRVLPNVAAPAQGWAAHWEYAKKRLFSPIKLPAWLVYFIAAYRLIPDVLGETDWWWERARNLGGVIGLGAILIASPYFALCLIICATAWLLWAGEAKTAVRHPSLQYVGWALSGFIALSTFAIAEAGYVASLIGGGQRHLTLQQVQIISREARALSPSYYYAGGKKAIGLSVMSVDTPEANEYTIEIMTALVQGKISLQTAVPSILAPLPMRALSPNVRGVFIQVRNTGKKPWLATKTAQILIDANIPVLFVNDPVIKDTDFILTVGLP